MNITDQQLMVVGCAAALFGLVVIAARIVMVRRAIRRSVFNTSRFPLFAARDRLIELVRVGAIAEEDHVWSGMYGAVNDLLNPRKRHTLFSMLHESLGFAVRVASNKGFRQRFVQFRQEIDRKSEEVPALKEVLDEVNRALWEMYYRRTVIFWLRAYIFALRKLALLFGFIRGGISAYRSLRGDVFNDPSGGPPPSAALAFARCST
jgi:hypothetical protein